MTVVDKVNHVTSLWVEGGGGHYTKKEDMYFKYFSNMLNFKGGKVIEIGPGTGEFALRLMHSFLINEYTIIDLKRNMQDSMNLLKENGFTARFIESKDYKKSFNRSYDLFVSNMCLSEVPDYYREDIFDNVLPNCDSVFIADGDAENNFNDWLIESIKKNFEVVHIEETGYYKCIAISGYKIPVVPNKVLGKGCQPYINDEDTRDPTLALETLDKELSKVSGLHGTILDVGCGNGRLNILHAKRFDKIIGIDLFRDPNPKYLNDKFEFLKTNIFGCSKKADVVLFLGTFYLHYDSGYESTLKKAKSLLNPGGAIVIFDDASRDGNDEKPGYYNLTKMCSNLGLHIVQKERQEIGKCATYVIKEI